MQLKTHIKKIPGIYNIYSTIRDQLPFPFKLGLTFSKTYFWLQKTQWYSQKQIQEYQNKNLRKIIKHAYKNIPYYRKIFDERGLKPKDIRCKEDLRKVPFLTKAMVRKNFKDLIWNKAKNYTTSYTSGSTGVPLEVKVNLKTYLIENALYWRYLCWAGYRFGSRIAKFWSLEHFIKGDKKFYRDSKLNTLYLNPLILSKEIIQEYINVLKDYMPEFIIANPGILNILCRYLKHQKIKNIFPLKAIFTSGTALYSELRREIQNQFHCLIFDWYNQGEYLISACECEKHQGHHVNFENAILEIVKNNDYESKGEFILTTFTNNTMPLIRYRIEDEGKLSDGLCSCGRKTPVLKSIKGKNRNFIITPDKKIIYGRFFYIFLNNIDWIYQAQFVQEKINALQIKIVKMYEPTNQQLENFLSPIKEILSKNMKIELEFVDDVEITRTGKRNLVISKVPIEF